MLLKKTTSRKNEKWSLTFYGLAPTVVIDT